MAEFEEEGVEIYEVDIEPFKELVQGVYDAFPQWTPGLYDESTGIVKKSFIKYI